MTLISPGFVRTGFVESISDANLYKLQSLSLGVGRRLPVARPASLLGYKGGCAFFLIDLRETLNLPTLQS